MPHVYQQGSNIFRKDGQGIDRVGQIQMKNDNLKIKKNVRLINLCVLKYARETKMCEKVRQCDRWVKMRFSLKKKKKEETKP